MPSRARLLAVFSFVFIILLVLHLPFLRLPYYWDEAGYYVPAALDFMRHGLLIPRDTLPTGHTPLVMVYLGAIWRLFGFSELVTRGAMILIAAATILATYALSRRVASREAGAWAAALLALSPLFFAQSSLVFLDLTAALFTTLALLFALDRRWAAFALTASLAVLSKETAVVVLPAVWVWMLVRKERRIRAWAISMVPVIPLTAWALFYHSKTG
ncbi:MAG: glycosyltransferase family 39 protein, partial [Terriglobia bacterium]